MPSFVDLRPLVGKNRENRRTRFAGHFSDMKSTFRTLGGRRLGNGLVGSGSTFLIVLNTMQASANGLHSAFCSRYTSRYTSGYTSGYTGKIELGSGWSACPLDPTISSRSINNVAFNALLVSFRRVDGLRGKKFPKKVPSFFGGKKGVTFGTRSLERLDGFR